MSQVDNFISSTWTAGDLFHRFGEIPLDRVVRDPPPGTATVDDVVRLDDHHDRLCELIDGTLVEKPKSVWESYLAVQLGAILSRFVKAKNLGIVLGTDGMMQLFPNQVRIPDVSYISWQNLKESGFPEVPVPHMSPTLAVEVISRSNTPQEMHRKLGEYFQAGTSLVWYIYPKPKQVRAYTAPTVEVTLDEGEILTGDHVLPGLEIPLADYCTVPTDPNALPGN